MKTQVDTSKDQGTKDIKIFNYLLTGVMAAVIVWTIGMIVLSHMK